jgi:hypothetical protein
MSFFWGDFFPLHNFAPKLVATSAHLFEKA